jgi:hypothetical protein
MTTAPGNSCDRHLDVLLLYKHYASIAATVEDHLCAIERYARHRFFRFPLEGDFLADLDLKRFDALVVHYTLQATKDYDLSARTRERLRQFRGLKAMFIQDEYRYVNETVKAIQDLGIHVLFTCVPEPEIEKVYPQAKLPHVRKINVLTGYVSESLLGREVPPFTERRIDVGYRGRTIPVWLGELGQEKWRIGHRFAEDATAYGLTCDIKYREEDRLYGEAWVRFLTSCKATLGVESGASVFDFTGEIQQKVEEHQMRFPDVTFEELRDLYFKDLEGRITLNQISPRCFECAALRTVMVLYEGDYSGILHPWRHYIPLKKDHSNMAEVVAALRDAQLCERITEAAYREVAENEQHSFRTFADKVGTILESAFRPEMGKTFPAYSLNEFETVRRKQMRRLMIRRTYSRMHRMLYLAIFQGFLFWASPQLKNQIHLRLRYYYRLTAHRLLSQVERLIASRML